MASTLRSIPIRVTFASLAGGALALVLVAGCAPLGGGGTPPPAAPAEVREDESERMRMWADSAALLGEVRALAEAGDTSAALSALLRANPDRIPTTPQTRSLARVLTSGLDGEGLARVLQGVPPGTPLAGAARVAYARTLRLAGDAEGARRFARAALEADIDGELAEQARALLEGRPIPGLPPARLTALLPLSGSPGLQRYAQEIRDGVEAAVSASPLGPDGVELGVVDTGGDPAATANLLRTLEAGGSMAVVGPLESSSMAAAVEGRRGVLPLISPTVWELPDAAPGVYSLGSDDIRGPTVLAEWALSAGITQVVLLAPRWGPGSGEVGVFRETFEGGGGSVLRVLDYEPGAAFFGEQMEVIRGLRPQGLVLPIPPEDVQAIAGQAAYFALDTLGVQLLGTGGWADDQVVQEVSERYLEGVVAAAPIRPDDDGAGYRRFVEAYENHFQRTLVEPALPALGYDAAILLLETMEMGARTPEDVQRALAEIRDLPGATGLLAVEDGRVVRQHQVVCFAGRQAIPLGEGERPLQVFRPYTPDEVNPRTGQLPEGPGHPAGFACPRPAADLPGVRPAIGGVRPDTGAVRRLLNRRPR